MNLRVEAFDNKSLAQYYTGQPLKEGGVDYRVREIAAQVDYSGSPQTDLLIDILDGLRPGLRLPHMRQELLSQVELDTNRRELLYRITHSPQPTRLYEVFSRRPTNTVYTTDRERSWDLVGLSLSLRQPQTVRLHKIGRLNDVKYKISQENWLNGRSKVELVQGVVLYSR